MNQLWARMQTLCDFSKNLSPNDHALFMVQIRSVSDLRAEFSETVNDLEEVRLEMDDNYEPNLDKITAFAQMADSVLAVGDRIARDEHFANQVRAQPAACKVKLEPIQIPKFDGSLENWEPFIQTFTDLIHNNDGLSDLQRVNYLVSHLTGSAKSVVASVPPTEANYELLLGVLRKRFEDRRAQGHYYLDKILNFKSTTQESEKALNSFLEGFVGASSALKKIGIPDLFDFLLLHVAGKKLDSDTMRQFDMKHREEEVPTFDSLVSFAHEQSKILARSKRYVGSSSSNRSPGEKPSHSLVAQQNVVSSPRDKRRTNKCSFCKEASHDLVKCSSFLKSTPKQRYNFVRRSRLCFRCLSAAHFTVDCESSSACPSCGHGHHGLLHFVDAKSSNFATKNELESQNQQSESVEPSTIAMSGLCASNTLVLLSTARVTVRDRKGNPVILRALLDCGSQSHFLTKGCCEKLGLRTKQLRSHVKCLGKGTAPIEEQVCVTFQSLVRPSSKYSVRAYVLSELTDDMPAVPVNMKHLDHLASLNLADSSFNVPGPIDMLIGAELWPLIVGERKIVGPPHTPFALESSLGWLIMGTAPIAAIPSQKPQAFHAIVAEEPLDNLLEKFWTIEEVPNGPHNAPEDSACEQYYLNTVGREPDGRFVVALPFRKSPPLLGDSLGQATRRFLQLERRLSRSPELFNQYKKVMQGYLDEGYLSVVPAVELTQNREAYYIPHHGVMKSESSSTPLRIVMDASCRTTTGVSLNDVLYVGPKLQNDLFVILLNFRLFRVAITSDIRQMYLRILVRPEDRRFQRILFRFSSDEPICTYQMNTVVFGIAPSPYLALRTVRHLIDLEGSRFPRAAAAATRDLYVDDFLSSVDSEEEAVLLKQELCALFASGSFQLLKWGSNSEQVLETIPVQERSAECLTFDSDASLKVLGLRWNPLQDTFSVQINRPPPTCTKRTMLSAIAKIFDPLGFLAPLTVLAKLLIRTLWSLRIDWDDAPPEEIVNQWRNFVDDLHLLAEWHIPRHSFVSPGDYSLLVGFADASQAAYGAVIYVVSYFPGRGRRANLLCAKSKVAPTKSITIPRLELCAAVLLSKLLRLVLNQYEPRHPIQKVYALTDSTVALQWISSPPAKWTVFVANRVAQVQENLDQRCWYHVRGETNAADCLSRGLTAGALLRHPLWFGGPHWLLQEEDGWPITRVTDISAAYSVPEEKVASLASVALPASSEWPLEPLLDRVSTYRRLLRSTVYVLRALRLSLARSGVILASEIEEAEKRWLVYVQRQQFAEIFTYLDSQGKLSGKQTKPDPLIGRLDLFIKDGLIRVGGRLNYSGLDFDHRHPVILPKKGKFVELLIDQHHVDNLHTGPHLLMAILQRRFWILSGRDIVRRRVQRCNTCFRNKPKPLQPKMAPLPSIRFEQCKAFLNCGVDFAGPFSISMVRRRGGSSLKAYICLFVCLTTKAIHLELASNLTTECFLAAFRRFLSRRGPCHRICSDQGTNFIGAKNFLSDLYRFTASSEFNDAIGSELSHRRIEWKLNPPAAPHFGGIWEANVRSVKTHLVKLIGSQLLTYEEFATVLAQVEAVLNSRPLSVLSADPGAPAALTPAHFLTMGPPLDHLPIEDFAGVPVNRLGHFQLVSAIVKGFWKRWQQEYLHTLQNRRKWTTDAPPVSEGTVVVIMKEDVPPLRWPLAVIKRLCPGPDGVPRVAIVKTTNGELTRPLVRLCPLPSQ
ncbi:Pao retrotransposon peptidase [Nesidiocoris tenuis]|uniref:Pao retrotransposon peptidase n=1 Tax=Nesidiocoris tenuis TaxID=355587 RepID=A0ABN7B724_9HEMI|nr:Pao retrotransposon peptidase [Nesidiocoris tenuis]